MKKIRTLSGIFLSVLLTMTLTFAGGATAFAAGVSVNEEEAVHVLEEKEQQESNSAEVSAEAISAGSEEPGVESAGEESSGMDSSIEESETGMQGSSDTASAEEAETTEDAETAEEETEKRTEAASETEISASEEVGTSAETDTEDRMQEMFAVIREEYGQEAAESFERMMKNANMKALVTAVDEALKAEFPGMTDEEIAEKLDSMSDEEAEALMEKIFSDPLISGLLEAVASDEDLAEDMDIFMNAVFGDLDMEELPEKLTEAVQGTQGDNISWVLTTDGTLTISGKGAIAPDHEEFLGEEIAAYGWDDYIDYVTKIVIKDGITNVPEDAFSYSASLKAVIVPASVTSVESAAFAGCIKLTAVYFLGNAPEIAQDAFEDCSESLTLYYLDGSTGWDKVKGYKLSVWKAASSEESIKNTEGENSGGTSSAKASSADKSTEAVQTSGQTPGTGDTTGNIYPLIILMAAALACGAVIVIRMRRKK